MRVFVLLFNGPDEQGGIHTLQIRGRNLILMFESEDDATRYALLLEAQDFLAPTVEAIDSEEIEEFCRDADYDWKLISEGFVPQGDLERIFLAPPEANLEETDWQPDAAEPEIAESDESPELEENPELDRIRRQLEGLL